MAARDQ